MNGGGWYARPVAAVCAVAALGALSLAALVRSTGGNAAERGELSFFVTIRDYGIDAREMERSVAQPLEDAFSAIPGARDVASVSEYGKVRASLRFPAGSGSYEAVREAAQRVYERLPPSAQRPEIGSSRDGRIPVWVAAVSANGDLDRLIEKGIKPAIERIEGVGEVELAGTGVPEIRVIVREDNAAALSLDASAIASFLSANDGVFSAGLVRTADTDYGAATDARSGGAAALRKVSLPVADGSALPLEFVARVEEATRESDARSRVDGVPAAVVSVIPDARGDPERLSRSLAAVAARFPEARFRVLADRGAEAAASRRSILAAACQGAAAVACAAALIARGAGVRSAAAGALSVPFTLLLAASFLAAAGFPLNPVSLSGLAAGLGSAVDAAILTLERVGGARGEAEKRRLMRALAPSLLSGGATTLIVLVPLYSMDRFAPGSAALAGAVASTTAAALLTAFILLPPFLGDTPARRRRARSDTPRAVLRSAFSGRVRRAAARVLAANAAFCARRPAVPLFCAAALSIGSAAAACFAGVDVGCAEEGVSIYAHIEAESGASMESVDERLASWARELRRLPGVESVQTSARPGGGSAVVCFDPKRTNRRTLSDRIRSAALPGAFVFLPEASEGERSWKLTVSGDDDRVCRDIASRVAARLEAAPFVAEAVLNFKDGPDRLLVLPDRERLSRAGLDFARAADALRRAVHGPVAYKRTSADGEIDVRVGLSRAASSSLGSLTLVGSAGAVKLDSVAAVRREADVGRIVRADRKRTASLTIRTAAMDPRRARAETEAALEGFVTPTLYTIEFDRQAIEAARDLSRSVFLLLAALVLSYMTLAALAESFGAPLAALAAVPPSLAVPLAAAVLCGGAVNAASAAAFVAVSGTAVNAAVLTVDARRSLGGGLPAAGARGLYRLTRSRAASLAATCGTTVAGAAPLLLLTDTGNRASRALAFVTVLGTAASFVASLTVVPALAAAAPRLFDTWRPSADPCRLGRKRNRNERTQP